MTATTRPSAEQAARRAPATPASGIRAIGMRSGYDSVASSPGSTTYMRSGSTKNSGNARPGQRSTPPDAATTAVPASPASGTTMRPSGAANTSSPSPGNSTRRTTPAPTVSTKTTSRGVSTAATAATSRKLPGTPAVYRLR